MIVNIKRINIGILIITVFVASCIAAFYTIKKYNNKVAKSDTRTSLKTKSNLKSNNMQIPVSAAVSNYSDAVISEKTKIIKKYNYNMGIPTTEEVTEVAGPDILGMDKKAAAEYFNKEQFYIMDFSSNNVTLFKDINTWPPNYYVVKAENNAVNIYKADNKGILQFQKKAQYDIESLPDTDKNDLKKGKAFPTLEDIDNMFNELNS